MTKSNKILIFSTAYYPFVGGAEVAIREITDRLPNIEFDLITAKMNKGLPFRERIGNVTVYRLGIGVPLVDKLIVALEGWVFARHLEKKNKYDAYWCMMASFASGSAFISNIFSGIISKKKTPIILTLQEGDSEKYLEARRFGLVNLSWRLALARTDTLTVISNYLGERAKRLGFKGQVELVPNGVNVNKFTKEISKEEKIQIRKDLGLGDSDMALVTTSRLNVKNGVGDVIKALTHLPDHFKFVVCGVGELENELKKLAKDINVGDRVIWKGLVSHDDLPKYLKSCDIFIRPSLSEGMGNSFIEAMAAGIPVIATPVGGITDFLTDDPSKVDIQTGYFCEPQKPESIVATTMRIISDPNKSRVLENAKQLVTEKYNWDQIAVQMKAVFDRMTQ